LTGGYFEHTIAEGGINKREWFGPGRMRFRWTGRKAHRLELLNVAKYNSDPVMEQPANTIFITGPVLRRWGFHDAVHGWVDAYDWDAHCDKYGITAMRMEGGSDAAISDRNKHNIN
jgi:hypothetical protein